MRVASFRGNTKYDAEVFLAFLKNIVSRYSEGKIVMILDNAKIHHANLLTEFFEDIGEINIKILTSI